MPLPSCGRLVVIHHECERWMQRKNHFIHLLIPLWEKAGVEVREVYGTKETPPADVAFMHVDLSVIPPAYQRWARSYPVVINGRVNDIRKSRLSLWRVDAHSLYPGQVIVKTELNHAGGPETGYHRHRSRWQRLLHPLSRRLKSVYPIPMRGKGDYTIYPTIADVPAPVWTCPDLVVEKFLPELHGGLYCLREWYFFGGQSISRVELSPDPIFTSAEPAYHLERPAPPELHLLRKRLGFDYGKFDYTLVDGVPVVFDFNKTVGVNDPANADVRHWTSVLSLGLHDFFPSEPGNEAASRRSLPEMRGA